MDFWDLEANEYITYLVSEEGAKISESNYGHINISSISQSSIEIHPSTSDIDIRDYSSDSTLSDPPSFLNTPVFDQPKNTFSNLDIKEIEGLVALGPPIFEIPGKSKIF